MKIITNEMAVTLDSQIKRARARFEGALAARRYYFVPLPMDSDDAYELTLSRRIHWHHQWLKYGESLAEAVRTYNFRDYDRDRAFTATVNFSNEGDTEHE